MTRILVTGVRGKTGTALAALTTERDDVELLGGSSDPGSVDLEGVQPVAFSWDDPSGWPPAVEGVDAVFLVRPDRADAPELLAAFVEVLAPDTRVVLLSEQDADFTGPDGWAPRAERSVREGGRPWTVLRPSWFMQVFTDARFYRDPVVEQGDLPFTSGGERVAWIDAHDIAAVALAALVEDGHEGRTYEITGPQALTLPETAILLAEAAGRPVTHRDVTPEEAATGTEGFEHELTVLTFERVRAGSFAPVTDTVEQVTGRPARSFAAFLEGAGLGS